MVCVGPLKIRIRFLLECFCLINKRVGFEFKHARMRHSLAMLGVDIEGARLLSLLRLG